MDSILTNINNVIVTSIEIKPLTIPLPKAFSNHLRAINKVEGLLCLIHTNVGIKGQGLVYGLGKIAHEVAVNCIDHLIPRLINKCIYTPKQINTLLLDANLPSSFELNNVIAAIDIAIWDIYLKEKNIPLHKIFSSERTHVPVYDTAGWLSLSDQELINTCQNNLMHGINAFKLRLGHENDRERVALLRATMGEAFTLMVDANQRFNVEEAINIIDDLLEFNLTWIEEPVGQNLNDLKHVANQSSIPIAVGENIKCKNTFLEICQNKLANYLQPDIRSCMGLTGFIEVCELTQEYAIPLCSHLMQELSSSVIAGYSNGYWVEYLDLISPDFFTHDFSIKNGKITLPHTPGTGVELTHEAMQRFAM
ncbi:MAG: mandelate racemase/muconate lactonizing enzyme family protein [Gammaproteobacteria bacterium]|nr:mandelate racemase/muconate lactonizing enzyme family protein [Gammaproteobacteria bacterium]